MTTQSKDTPPENQPDTPPLPHTLALLPVTNRPFFPTQVQPISLPLEDGELLQEAARESGSGIIGICFVNTGEQQLPDTDRFSETGCAARLQQAQVDGNRITFIAEGLTRFRINRWLRKDGPPLAEVAYPAAEPPGLQTPNLARSLLKDIARLVPLNPDYEQVIRRHPGDAPELDAGALADFAASMISASGEELQAVLDTVALTPRLEQVLRLFRQELEVKRLHQQIEKTVDQNIKESQREFFLRHQLRVIQEELGLTKDDRTADVETFQARLNTLTPPDAVAGRCREELKKLSILQSGSPEYAVTRNYLDWVTSLPWGIASKDQFSLTEARQVLDRHNAGLEDVKQRIIEFLAVGAYRGIVGGSVMLLCGPPGVGKTALGKCIAASLGRQFYRFSVGGLQDESEIKGHRRTYVGAMPGKFIQALKTVGVANPVIMLDEVDKVTRSYQGDPGAALLEVLDPEQNDAFTDNYLDLPVDLSQVLFICTANQLDTIPQPLLDRMDIIRMAGYVAEEKYAIARNHLWPGLLERHHLQKKQISLTDSALRQIIEGYARDAGVRNLEKLLMRIIRKAVVQLLESPDQPVRISINNLEQYLGPAIFRKKKTIRGIGVATGLAWTPRGGVSIPIEAARIHTLHRGFNTTGKLGAVMRESAHIAFGYVTAHLAEFGGNPHYFDRSFIHLHVPEGATPKDGPSAGITMATALISLACDRKIDRPLAMSGELTLTGQVFAIGGVREKIIAAKRSRISEIILPAANQRDVDELPEHILQDMTIHYANDFYKVFQVVFGKPEPAEKPKEPVATPSR